MCSSTHIYIHTYKGYPFILPTGVIRSEISDIAACWEYHTSVFGLRFITKIPVASLSTEQLECGVPPVWDRATFLHEDRGTGPSTLKSVGQSVESGDGRARGKQGINLSGKCMAYSHLYGYIHVEKQISHVMKIYADFSLASPNCTAGCVQIPPISI